MTRPKTQVFPFGGTSFCWHCHRKLADAPKHYGLGAVYASIVRDVDGNLLRVHATCVKDVENATLVPAPKP